VNVSVGRHLAVLRCPEGISEPTEQDFLQPGTQGVCRLRHLRPVDHAGAHDRPRRQRIHARSEEIGEFMLTQPEITIEPDTSEFAINASNSRHWEPAIKRYVQRMPGGAARPARRDFNMRWIASLVAETHRILMRGGVFMYPRDRKDSSRNGRVAAALRSQSHRLPHRAGGAGGPVPATSRFSKYSRRRPTSGSGCLRRPQ